MQASSWSGKGPLTIAKVYPVSDAESHDRQHFGGTMPVCPSGTSAARGVSEPLGRFRGKQRKTADAMGGQDAPQAAAAAGGGLAADWCASTELRVAGGQTREHLAAVRKWDTVCRKGKREAAAGGIASSGQREPCEKLDGET